MKISIDRCVRRVFSTVVYVSPLCVFARFLQEHHKKEILGRMVTIKNGPFPIFLSEAFEFETSNSRIHKLSVKQHI